MITIPKAWESYYDLSGRASDAVRQLAFAGIAIIWVFKTESQGVPEVPPALLPAGLMIAAALFLDLLQYVLAAALWHRLIRSKERSGTEPDAEWPAPDIINLPASLCYWGKIALVLLAYIGIGRYLLSIVERWYILP